jgi:hypothetical protein
MSQHFYAVQARGDFFTGFLGNPESYSGGSRNSIRGLNHFSRGGHEFVQSRARNNDCISPTMRFFGDTHKPAALVFSEFYIEVLTLNLQLSRYDDIVHDIFWRGYRYLYTFWHLGLKPGLSL